MTPAEQPVWSLGEIVDRARNEAIWHEGAYVQVIATTQGWKGPSGSLWQAGSNIYVNSPMALIEMVLCAQTVTYTQSNEEGTLTMLELVPPWLLKGTSEFVSNNPNMVTAPANPQSYEQNPPAQPNTTVPPAPPAQLPD